MNAEAVLRTHIKYVHFIVRTVTFYRHYHSRVYFNLIL